MLFTTKTEYGLKALTMLAKNGQARPLSLASIAGLAGYSQSYLEQLFARLKKAGLIKSVKGKSGGYVLSRPANQIKLLAVILALDGQLAVNDCLSANKINHCSAKCRTKKVWQKIRLDMEKTLNNYKLSDLV